MKQILIKILIDLLPYYFTNFAWYRSLVYMSNSYYLPINLGMVQYLIDHQNELEIVRK